jgi:hypothetical protein
MLNRLKDVFACFQKHNVKYLVIGGIASVMHGVPRMTFDLDILIEPELDNAQRLLDALIDAKFGTALLTTAKDVLAHEISIFQDRVRIDVQTRTPGIDFKVAWEKKVVVDYQGQSFFLVSKDDLISSKLAAAREVDLEDARILRMEEKKE